MKSLRLVLIAMLMALPFAGAAKAQVAVGIGVGPEVVCRARRVRSSGMPVGVLHLLSLCLCTLWLLRTAVV